MRPHPRRTSPAEKATKRGGGLRRVEFGRRPLAAAADDERLLALDDALDRFAVMAAGQGGVDQAPVLRRPEPGRGRRPARHLPQHRGPLWAYARAWLRVEIGEEKSA